MILSLRERIRVSENLFSCIFYAVNNKITQSKIKKQTNNKLEAYAEPFETEISEKKSSLSVMFLCLRDSFSSSEI